MNFIEMDLPKDEINDILYGKNNLKIVLFKAQLMKNVTTRLLYLA